MGSNTRFSSRSSYQALVDSLEELLFQFLRLNNATVTPCRLVLAQNYPKTLPRYHDYHAIDHHIHNTDNVIWLSQHQGKNTSPGPCEKMYLYCQIENLLLNKK